MPYRRSPSKSGHPLLAEGLVCRESNVADRLVNKRWMQLYGAAPGSGVTGAPPEPPFLASFRHQADSEPSKVWEITRSCRWVLAGRCELTGQQQTRACRGAGGRAVGGANRQGGTRHPALARPSRGPAMPQPSPRMPRPCSVTEVERGDFHLRVDTSTLVAVIAAKFTDVSLVRCP